MDDHPSREQKKHEFLEHTRVDGRNPKNHMIWKMSYLGPWVSCVFGGFAPKDAAKCMVKLLCIFFPLDIDSTLSETDMAPEKMPS